MKPITNLYIKTFLFTGIPFGLATIIADYMSGEEISIWKFLFMTFSFGALMSITMVAMHKQRLKSRGLTNNTEIYQDKTIKSPLSLVEFKEKLMSDPHFKKMELLEMEDGFILKTKMSWESWGEVIRIKLISKNEAMNEYQISSRPKVKITQIDYGKNHENINIIEKAIA